MNVSFLHYGCAHRDTRRAASDCTAVTASLTARNKESFFIGLCETCHLLFSTYLYCTYFILGVKCHLQFVTCLFQLEQSTHTGVPKLLAKSGSDTWQHCCGFHAVRPLWPIMSSLCFLLSSCHLQQFRSSTAIPFTVAHSVNSVVRRRIFSDDCQKIN